MITMSHRKQSRFSRQRSPPSKRSAIFHLSMLKLNWKPGTLSGVPDGWTKSFHTTAAGEYQIMHA